MASIRARRFTLDPDPGDVILCGSRGFGPMSSTNKYDHIIVAVHGIGDQTRNATVRDVATRFARMPRLAKAGIFVAPQPLGYFHTDVTDAVKVFSNKFLDAAGIEVAVRCRLGRKQQIPDH